MMVGLPTRLKIAMSAPTKMHWERLLSPQRFKVKNGLIVPADAALTPESAAGLRTEFHIDHDRVVFSSAFRRLGRKTQVHPLASHDHTHNRLTHSVEVSCVGRSLGNRVGAMLAAGQRLPSGFTPFDIGSIVQVACLAHDIGNPPFGHTGEEALRDWFRDPAHAVYLQGLTDIERSDVQTYEGNAHGLRMVASLEMYAQEGGMRLTSAVLGALVKYPWTSLGTQYIGKFNIYHTEQAYFSAIADTLGLIQHHASSWARHPLSYLMEAADDICYAIVDLEDAAEIGILDPREFERLLAPLVEEERFWGMTDPRQKCAALRGTVVGKCVTEVADRFMAHQDALLSGAFVGKDLISVCGADVREVLTAAKALASEKIYRHRTKLVTEIAAYPCLATLLNALVPAVHGALVQGESALTPRLAAQLSLLDRPLSAHDTLYTAYMQVLDFVGSMTDNAAAALAREISGVGIV